MTYKETGMMLLGMFTGIKMSLPRETLDDLSTARFQENVARKLDAKQTNIGCLGGTVTNLGSNTFKVEHSLGKPVSSFFLLSHTTAGSIKASLVSSDGTSATIAFDHDPGTFTISFN